MPNSPPQFLKKTLGTFSAEFSPTPYGAVLVGMSGDLLTA